MSIHRLLLCVVPIAFGLVWAADSEERDLPAGPGKDAVATVCSACHAMGKIRRLRLPADGWAGKIDDMVDRGAQATPEQIDAVGAYLTANFGPGAKVRVNTAPLEELRAVLGLTADESSAVVAWRKKNGDFRSWIDVAKVPGVDGGKVEGKKDLMAF